MDDLAVSRAAWRKSSRSGQNGNCVELAQVADTVAVRDSKNMGVPHIRLAAADWRAFSAAVREGRYDLP